MAESRSFIVHREPKGKKRTHSRAIEGKNGKYYAQTYNDGENVTYEGIVRAEYVQQVGDVPPFLGPVIVRIGAFYEIPKSWSNKKKQQAAAGAIKPTKKPDCDNIAKMICDALNGLAYKDDAQVIVLNVAKAYTASVPFVHVNIESMEE